MQLLAEQLVGARPARPATDYPFLEEENPLAAAAEAIGEVHLRSSRRSLNHAEALRLVPPPQVAAGSGAAGVPSDEAAMDDGLDLVSSTHAQPDDGDEFDNEM